MKLTLTTLLAAAAIALTPAITFAKGGKGGGGRSSHLKSGRHASAGGGSSAGDGTCHTGPRGGRYTITPSGNKKYGC